LIVLGSNTSGGMIPVPPSAGTSARPSDFVHMLLTGNYLGLRRPAAGADGFELEFAHLAQVFAARV
jgi:hypothetical protein